jgi:hypothetical protein
MTHTLVDDLYLKESFIESMYLDHLGIPTYGIGCTVYNNCSARNPTGGNPNWSSKELPLLLEDNKDSLPFNGESGEAGLLALMNYQYNVLRDMVEGKGFNFKARYYISNYPAGKPRFRITRETALITMLIKLAAIERDVFKLYPWLNMRSQQLIDAYIKASYQMGIIGFYKKFAGMHLYVEDFNFIGAYGHALYGRGENTERQTQAGIYKTLWHHQTPQRAYDFLAGVAYDLQDAYNRVTKGKKNRPSTYLGTGLSDIDIDNLASKIERNYKDMVNFLKNEKNDIFNSTTGIFSSQYVMGNDILTHRLKNRISY